MYANSRIPESAQQGVHEHLVELVAKHVRCEFRKPYLDYNKAAFEHSLAGWDGKAPLILDAGCGVGWSTLRLAAEFPDHFVIGVDQSSDRLERGKPLPLPANALLLRADLVDFWRLFDEAGVRLARHYLLYPNPWPKIGHLSRRWHGHPVFPAMLELGGVLECRSNWRIYIEEFCFAIGWMTDSQPSCEAFLPEAPLTPFERKYLDSGHALWRTTVVL